MVDTIAMLCRIAVGLVFVVAGFAKLRDGFMWIRQAGDMGVPPSVARLVPWFELVLGLALISSLLQPWTVLVSVVVLVVFTVVIVLRLRDGTRPSGGCFGASSQRELGAQDVVRNGVLIVVAILAIVLA